MKITDLVAVIVIVFIIIRSIQQIPDLVVDVKKESLPLPDGHPGLGGVHRDVRVVPRRLPHSEHQRAARITLIRIT